jgi:hypothetical protein
MASWLGLSSVVRGNQYATGPKHLNDHQRAALHTSRPETGATI